MTNQIPNAEQLWDVINQCADDIPEFHGCVAAKLRNELMDSIGKLFAPAWVELEERQAADSVRLAMEAIVSELAAVEDPSDSNDEDDVCAYCGEYLKYVAVPDQQRDRLMHPDTCVWRRSVELVQPSRTFVLKVHPRARRMSGE